MASRITAAATIAAVRSARTRPTTTAAAALPQVKLLLPSSATYATQSKGPPPVRVVPADPASLGRVQRKAANLKKPLPYNEKRALIRLERKKELKTKEFLKERREKRSENVKVNKERKERTAALEAKKADVRDKKRQLEKMDREAEEASKALEDGKSERTAESSAKAPVERVESEQRKKLREDIKAGEDLIRTVEAEIAESNPYKLNIVAKLRIDIVAKNVDLLAVKQKLAPNPYKDLDPELKKELEERKSTLKEEIAQAEADLKAKELEWGIPKKREREALANAEIPEEQAEVSKGLTKAERQALQQAGVPRERRQELWKEREREAIVAREEAKIAQEAAQSRRQQTKFGTKEVYLPNFTITLVRDPKLPPTYAQFIVPLDFGKLDLRDYLYHAYKLRTLAIRSFVQHVPAVRDRRPERFQSPIKGMQLHRPKAIKKMTVQMEDPFIWPEPPESYDKWDKDLYERIEKFRDEMREPELIRGTKPNVEERRRVIQEMKHVVKDTTTGASARRRRRWGRRAVKREAGLLEKPSKKASPAATT